MPALPTPEEIVQPDGHGVDRRTIRVIGEQALRARKWPTTDRDVAEHLAEARVRELELTARRRSGVVVLSTLGPFAAHHLVRKAQTGDGSAGWLARMETRLQRALDFFGETRELDTILPSDVEDWIIALVEQNVGRGEHKRMSPGTIRHQLNALSNLYQRAIVEGRVSTGYNPVAALLVKPAANDTEARWLEVHEAALLLEAAHCYQPVREERTCLSPMR